MYRTISIILIAALAIVFVSFANRFDSYRGREGERSANTGSAVPIAIGTQYYAVGLSPFIGTFGNKPLSPLKISPNGRYFMTADGQPFFWLGDTGWLLFSKLTRENAIKYLDDRKQKGFNVIQVMVLH